MKRSLSLVLFVFLNGFFSLTLAQESSSRQIKIGFAYQDLESEFWLAGHRRITEYLDAKEVVVLERLANENAEQQMEQIRELLMLGVHGIVLITQNGDSAVEIVAVANAANVPIAVFNRPPSRKNVNAIVAVAKNQSIAEATVDYLVLQAGKLGRKITPLIVLGDLGDPNAGERREGFHKAIRRFPDRFHKPIEVDGNWNSTTALRNLQKALDHGPRVDLIFTSADFFHSQIKAVLKRRNRWHRINHPDHMILGGLDGDSGACRLMKDGYVDATGVQNVFLEAEMMLDALFNALDKGEKQPTIWLYDSGFALTQDNLSVREMDMWGCQLLSGE